MHDESHVMIDLETAGTGENAHVLTLGILTFDPYGDPANDRGFHIVMPHQSNEGRTIDPGTMRWWMRQSPMAQAQAWTVTPTILQEVMHLVETYVLPVKNIWANDPDFDCTILRSWGETNKLEWNWPFRAHRSLRTIKAMFDIPPLPAIGTAHNALDDCRYQAQIVRAVLQGKARPRYLAPGQTAALPFPARVGMEEIC